MSPSQESNNDEYSPFGREKSYYYDQHTLYIMSGVAYNWQLAESVKQALKRLNSILGKSIKCDFKVNTVTDKEGNLCGISYVWVSNPEVYNVLIGKNPDGTDRVEYYDDPSWEEPEGDLDLQLEELEDKPLTLYDSWGDAEEEERELIEKYTCPQLERVLPPLIKLPGYEYDPYQYKHIQMLALHNNPNMDLSAIPTKGYFKVSPAFVQSVDSDNCHYTLCTSHNRVPEWITEHHLKEVFKDYATDSTTKVERKINGEKVLDTYPFVTINDSRMAFITFNSNTRDAQFAYFMTRKLVINRENSDEQVTLIFRHSYHDSNHNKHNNNRKKHKHKNNFKINNSIYSVLTQD